MEPVGFWHFVEMCFGAAKEASLSLLGWDMRTAFVTGVPLLLGYILFAYFRGRGETKKRFWDDVLVLFSPLGITAAGIIFVNLIRSPVIVYRNLQQSAYNLDQQKQKCTSDLAAEKDKSQPKLKITIDQIMVGDMTSGTLHQPGTMVFASLTNNGAPSIAEGWTLVVTLPDGRSEQAVPSYMKPHSTTSGKDTSGNDWKMDNDALYEKTMLPIERGAKLRGELLFLTKVFTVQEIEKPGVKYVLSCVDFQENRVYGDFVWTDEKRTGLPQYYPGLHFDH
jgi:hypothetical protein